MAKHARLSFSSVHRGTVTSLSLRTPSLKISKSAFDEPLEERRKKMMNRIKVQAESNHQVVSVIDGVLSVNGKAVFSLKNGKINQDGGHQ
jgi:hypothetical protein